MRLPIVRDRDTQERLTDTGALSGDVNFLSDFTLHEDRLPDSFFEGAGANALSAGTTSENARRWKWNIANPRGYIAR